MSEENNTQNLHQAEDSPASSGTNPASSASGSASPAAPGMGMGMGHGCGIGCLSLVLVVLIMLVVLWLVLHVVIPMSYGQPPDLSLGLPSYLAAQG